LSDSDPQIFIFTAGNAAARSHLDDSILSPVASDLVYENFPESDREALGAIDGQHGFYAWGAVPGPQNNNRWQKLEKDDWVLCVYDSGYHFAARVLGKYDNADCARAIWGSDADGQTWQLMYFVTKPIETGVSLSDVAGYLGERYMGFTRIADAKLDVIRQAFGSIDDFVEEAIIQGKSVAPISTEPQHFLVRSNPDSHWDDEEGRVYKFGSTVPNYKRLIQGGNIVVDSKISGTPKIIGYGEAAPAAETDTYETEQRTNRRYEAEVMGWHAIEPPKEFSAELLAELRMVPGYNVQHAVRPITEELFHKLIAKETSDVVKPSGDSVGVLREIVEEFSNQLAESNIDFGAQHQEIVRAFISSLATKPFVILTGLSGSGKTQLAIRFGEWLGDDRLLVTAVRPDWTGAESLFGYEDALKPADETGASAWHVPAPLEFLLAASRNPDDPYVLVLDEMNLAHVERYFADVLSGMESKKPCLPNLAQGDDGAWRQKNGPVSVPFPRNVFVVGTVNVDETTYMFSPKVLDRANTFEFRVSDADLKDHYNSPQECSEASARLRRAFLTEAQNDQLAASGRNSSRLEIGEKLRACHRILSPFNFEFGHRVFSESLRFATIYAGTGMNDVNAILDRILMQKILPRLHGSRRRLEKPMIVLANFAFDPDANSDAEFALETADASAAKLPISFDKLRRMVLTVRANQFVSFTD
jgi:hypothetical protein